MTSVEGENIIEIFDNWFKHYMEITNYLGQVEENMKKATMQIETLTKAKVKLQSDCSTLQGTVLHCQQQLQTLCDLEDEVRHLKQHIAEKEQVFLKETAQNMATIASIKQAHESEKESLLSNVKIEYDKKLDNLEDQLKIENESKRLLQSQLEEIKQDKEKEISKITMEYESKLIKAHRQKAQYIQQQQQIINQDVLRKKMQHMKENYEQEIADLKSQIQDLKHMLESLHQERQRKDDNKGCCEQQLAKLQPQKLYLQDRHQPQQHRGQQSYQGQRPVHKHRSGSKIKQ